MTALKSALASVEGVPAEQQVLTYGGVPLDDECVVTESVPELATLSVTVRVVGGQFHVRWRKYRNLFNAHCTCPHLCFFAFCPGKVHGSLARAGKVRGQTPKVHINIFVENVYSLSFYVGLIMQTFC